jgi:hypothetical protein
MGKFRTLYAHEIDVRIGQAIATSKWQGVSLLLYKNARVDMDILDETVGAENWQRNHNTINENLYCNVGIWDEKKGQWVWKSDCGVESNTEKEKGEASDSFKRACVNWGIGRELYTAPKDMLVNCELDEKKKPKDKKLKFYVSHINYENGRISELVIVNQNGEVLYTYPKKGVTPSTKPLNGSKSNDNASLVKPITRGELLAEYGVKNPQQTILWLEDRFKKEMSAFTDEETRQARAMLDKKKAEREAELKKIDDADIPFPMED